jgi:chromosome segregation ATPase
MCRKMEVSRVDTEGEKTPLSSLSGGEKVIIQMCLIFALWTVSWKTTYHRNYGK